MPLSMDPSETNTGASDAASADDTSTADPGDAASGTADMTSQNPTASAMNPSRLLRTALFSVLGLLLAGGLMAAQAQEEIGVDADASNNTQAPYQEIQTAVNNATANDIIVVEATGPYDESVTVDQQDLTIEASSSTKPEVDGGTNGPAFEVTADGVKIDGFEIRSDLSSASAVVKTTGPSSRILTLTGNDIIGEAGGASGQDNDIIQIKSGLVATGNVIESEGSEDQTFGVASSSNEARITIGGEASSDRNTFRGILVGIQIEDGAENGAITVQNNLFDNIDGEAVIFSSNDTDDETEDITVTSNDFGGTNGGVGGGVFFLDKDANFTGNLSVTQNNFSVDGNGIAIAATQGSFDGSGGGFTNDNVINAKDNYYGAADGPSPNSSSFSTTPTVVRGSGAEVTRDVAFLPFLDAEDGSSTFYGGTITVDREGSSNPSALQFTTIEEAVQHAVPGDAIEVTGIVDQSGYTGDVSGNERPSGFQESQFRDSGDQIEFIGLGTDDERVAEVASAQTVTVRATNAEVNFSSVVETNNVYSQNSGNVTLEFDGNNESFLASGGVGLFQGRIAIASTGDLQVADDQTVTVGNNSDGGADVDVNRLAFEGGFDVTYNVSSDFSSDGELPQNPQIETLSFQGSDNRVTIRENDVTVTEGLSFSSSTDATFNGNLIVDDEADGTGNFSTITVSSGSDLSVKGSITSVLANTFDIEGTLNGASGLSSPSNFTVENISGETDIFLIGAGTAEVNDLTVGLNDDAVGNGGSESREAVLAADGTGTLTIEGTADENLKGSSDSGDAVFFEFKDDANAATFEIGGGDNFADFNSFGSPSELRSTIQFNGDATVAQTAGATVDLGADDGNGGTIEVASDATLTVLNESGSTVIHDLGTLSSGDGDAPGSYDGGGTLALGGSGDHTIQTGDAGGSQVVDGNVGVSVVANSNVTFDGDNSGDSNQFKELLGLDATGGNDIVFTNTANTNVVAGDATVQTDGRLILGSNTVQIQGLLDVQSEAGFNAQGTLDLQGDLTLDQNANLTYSAALDITGSSNSSLQLGRSLSAGSEDLTIDKTAARIVVSGDGDLTFNNATIQNPGAISTAGALELDGSNLTLNNNLTVNSEDVNGNTENSIVGSGEVIFAGAGTIQDNDANAAPTLGNVRVNNGGSNVDVAENFLFSGSLTLESGTFNINGNPSDLSPVGQSSAVSIFAGGGSSISTANADDTFNREENTYDVEYVGNNDPSNPLATGNEISSNVRDLQVSPSGSGSSPTVGIELNSDVAPSGDVSVAEGGELTSSSASLDLNGASSVTVDGELRATLTSITGSQTISGGGILGDITADGTDANLTISGLERIGTVTATGESAVSVSLTGTDSGDQTADRIVTDGGSSLTLGSAVTVESSGVSIGGSSTSGTLNLAGNNLTITSGDLIGTAGADFQAGDDGYIVLNTSGIADVSRDGPVENVRLENLGGDTGFGSGNELAFDGDAILAGDIVDGGASSFEGSLVAVGSTITINGTSDKRLPNLIVDSGDGETTTVLDPSGSSADDPESGTDEPNAENLVVSGELTFASGELDHQTSVEVGESLTYAPASEDAADFAVTASGGSVVLDGANVTLNRALTVPSLETGGGSSLLVANSDDDPFNLRIGSDLTLGAPFDAGADNTGDLVITSAEGENVQVERTSYSGTDVLTEPLVFEEPGTTYDLTYTGSSNINSGLEAVDGSGQGQIDSLKVNASATVTFSDAELGGSVTANERLELLDGTVQHTASDERQVAIADGATLLRDDGRFDDRTAPSDQVNADGAYTLVYASDGEEDGVGDATDEEFLSDTEIDLVVRTAEDGDTDEVLNVLPGNRTVSSLTVENDTGDETSLGDGSDSFTLTVNGGTEVNGGLLDGSLNAQGDVTVAEGDVSEAALTFAGNSNQALSLSETEEVSGIELAQTTPDGESVPSVTVSGGGLEPTSSPTFGNGLLVVEGDNALDLGTNGFSRSTADGDTSHVVGSVTQRVTSGNTVVEYPVGSSNASYRPFGFIFPEDPTQNTDITVTHVDENPGEVGGLPFNDNTGVRIGQDYPDYYWTTESSRRLSISGTYEAFAQAEGLRFPDESADDFRIIRRPDSGDSWSLVGDGTGYSNTPISESEGRVDVSTTAATSDIRQSVGLFTIGQPAGDAPQIATNEGLTLTEGESAPITSAELEATDGDNAAGELTFEVTSGPSQGEIQVDGSQSSTFTQADVNNELVSYNHTASSSDNDSFELEVSDPNGNSVSATFDVTVEVGQVAISGSVNYPTVSDGNVVDGRALEGVEVEATSGDVTATATTDADGNFTIDGLDSGDYEVTANVDRDVSNVSIGDAQRTVSGFAGTEPFAGAFQEEVADVNASGTANATDALRIAFFDLGSVSSFEAGSFLVDTTEVTLGSESESGVSIRVAEFGDADLSGGSSDSGGDASLATTTVSPKSSAQTAAQTAAKSATESAGDANRVAAGETFEVPVRVDRGAEVGSYSLSLEYDTEKATFEGISSGRDDIITNGSKEDGTLQVGWFDRSGESTLELTGGSELVTLRFSAAEGVEGAEFAPEITGGEINGPGAKAVAAGVEIQAVRIAKPAPDEFALNGSYPNPASQQATVEMDLPVRAQVTVEVYNTLGQRVQTVEQSMSAGAGQTVQLDASQLASGQYFYRVKASLDGNQTRETGRLTIVK